MIDADRIREATEQVLGRPAYDELQASLLEQVVDRVRGWFADLIDQVLGSAAAGGIGQLVAIGLVVALIVAGVLVVRGLRRSERRDPVVELADGSDARALLAAARTARAEGRLEEAVRQRYGALVLALVEAGVVDGRPGLTVGEVDAHVRSGLPTTAAPVAAAGRRLADVVYGAAVADQAADDEVALALDCVARATGRRELRDGTALAAAGAGSSPGASPDEGGAA